MHNYYHTMEEKYIPFNTLNIFIIIHLSKYKCRDLNTRIIILGEACPATSYVAATFHPTIG